MQIRISGYGAEATYPRARAVVDTNDLPVTLSFGAETIVVEAAGPSPEKPHKLEISANRVGKKLRFGKRR